MVITCGVPAAVVSTARTYWVTRVLCSPHVHICAFELALTGRVGYRLVFFGAKSILFNRYQCLNR